MQILAHPDDAQPFDEAIHVESAEGHLWQRLSSVGDEAARAQLIELYMPYARTLAAVIYKGRFHDEVEFADYMQLACLGLVESVDRYDPEQGVQFRTFAAHRIRGAILNGLEKQTEKNQQIAAQQRLRKDRLDALKEAAEQDTAPSSQQSKGGEPSRADAGKALLAYMAEVGIGLALGILLEGTRMIESPEGDVADSAPPPEVGYFKKTETQRLQDLLRAAILKLNASERRVIRYHYQQDVSFEEISHILGVTRGRVSQIHRQALLNLRKALAQGPPCDVFL